MAPSKPYIELQLPPERMAGLSSNHNNGNKNISMITTGDYISPHTQQHTTTTISGMMTDSRKKTILVEKLPEQFEHEGGPADNEGWSADNEGWSADDEDRPADDESRPADNESRPADDESRPADNESRPVGNEGRPADNEGTPNDNEGRIS